MNRRSALLGAAALAACGQAAPQTPPAPFPMRRGVNLGNALEAPNEGEWGYRIEAAHIGAIAQAGFDGVRLPVRWDAHAQQTPPFTIDPAFMARVREVVEMALASHLFVQLDLHHYDALIAQPERERVRFLTIWRQIAEMFGDAPQMVLFEPLNEPHGETWTGARLAALQSEVLAVIRRRNPQRLVVFGGPNWNSIDGLRSWTPPQDNFTAVTVHYYEPHDFTHQGAEWLGANAPRYNRAWGSQADRDAVAAHIARAAAWSTQHGLAMQLGEFGVNRAVPLPQRAAWTRTVREACETHGLGWCAWDFAGAFPVWDRDAKRWIPQMLEALLP